MQTTSMLFRIWRIILFWQFILQKIFDSIFLFNSDIFNASHYFCCKKSRFIKHGLLSSQKYYYYRRAIRDSSEIHWRPIGNPSKTDIPDRRPIEDPSESYWKLIGDLAETYKRPIGHRHAWLETHLKPWHASSETHLKPSWYIFPIYINKQKV